MSKYFYVPILSFYIRLVKLFRSQLYSYFPHFCHKESDNLPDNILLSHFFFCGVILSLLAVMFASFSKFRVFCSRYTALSFLRLSILVFVSRFVSRNPFVSNLNSSNISFVLLMAVSCAAHARSYVECNKCFPYS